MAFNFNGKRFLVTGACSGLGKQIAISLTESGAQVYALSINGAALQTLKDEHPSIVTITQDVTKWHETKAVLEQLEPLDGLVNNIGILPMVPRPALEYDLTDLDKFMQTNLYSAINCIQVVSKKMIAAGKPGAIVNISSILGLRAFRGTLPYSISKAALDMVTKQFSLELAAYNIRVNSINPTLFMSDTTKQMLSMTEMPIEDAFKSRTPLGRLPETQDIVGPVLYLLSNHSAMVTGTTNVVDGGNLSCASA